MVKRRVILILTPYSKTHYFIDKGVQRGIVYDAGVKLETERCLLANAAGAAGSRRRQAKYQGPLTGYYSPSACQRAAFRWVRVLRLNTYSAPACAFRRVHEVLVLVHGQEDDTGRIGQSRQPPRGVETAHARHRNIQHDGIWFQRDGRHDRRFAVQRSADDLEFVGELTAHMVEDGLMVVGEQYLRSIH
jgi:hypothetical protein